MENIDIGRIEDDSRKAFERQQQAAYELSINDEEFNKRKELYLANLHNKTNSAWRGLTTQDSIFMTALVMREERDFYNKHGRVETLSEFLNKF